MSQQMIDSNFRFPVCCMGQHGETGDVSAGIDIGVGGLHVFIYFYVVPQEFDADGFKTQIRCIGFSSDTDQYFICFDRFRLSVFFNDHAVGSDFNNLGFKKEHNTFFSVFCPEHGGYFLIHRTEYFGHHLNDFHFYTHAVKKGCEFHADHSAADNGDRTG